MPSTRNFVSWFMETHLRASRPTTHWDKKSVQWWWLVHAAQNPESRCSTRPSPWPKADKFSSSAPDCGSRAPGPTRSKVWENKPCLGSWKPRPRQGLKAITEVATPEHVEKVLDAGMSAVWIGARTTVSPFAVQAIAEALKGTDLLVMVKNPMHADLKLWIGALERVASCTRGQVCGLHRGFSSYGSSEFRNAPMWEIPIALRSEMPEVPLFCDPSHISGKAEHLQDVAQRAMNLGMEGLMIESHPSPAQALSDAEQQITPAPWTSCSPNWTCLSNTSSTTTHKSPWTHSDSKSTAWTNSCCTCWTSA